MVVAAGMPQPRQIRELTTGEKSRTLVFHEFGLLQWCLATAAIVRARRLPHTVIFDLHDLYDPYTSSRATMRTALNQSAINQMMKLLPRLKVKTITVSEGLADRAEKVMGVRPEVMMNTPEACSAEALDRPRKIAYLGLIRPDRLPIEDIRKLQKEGLVVDVHGYSPDPTSSYAQELRAAIESGGGRLYGPYSPGDLGFLEGYSATLMLFENTSVNTRMSMPNKLFQSLCNGCIAIVSPTLEEVRHTFGHTGAVATLDEYLTEPNRAVDWNEVRTVTDRLRREGKSAYLRTIGWQ